MVSTPGGRERVRAAARRPPARRERPVAAGGGERDAPGAAPLPHAVRPAHAADAPPRARAAASLRRAPTGAGADVRIPQRRQPAEGAAREVAPD